MNKWALAVYHFALCVPWLLVSSTPLPYHLLAGVGLVLVAMPYLSLRLSSGVRVVSTAVAAATVLILVAGQVLIAAQLVAVVGFGLVYAVVVDRLAFRSGGSRLPDLLGVSLLAVVLLGLIPMLYPTTEPLHQYLTGITQSRSGFSQRAFVDSFDRLEFGPFALGRRSSNLRHTLAIGLLIGVALDGLRVGSGTMWRQARVVLAFVLALVMLSRSAWVIALLLLVPHVMDLLRSSSVKRVLAALGVGVPIVFIGGRFAGSALLDRLSGASDDSAELRTQAVSQALDAIVEATPFAPADVDLANSPHNLAVELGLAGGFFALVAGALLVAVAAWTALVALRSYWIRPSAMAYASWGLMSVFLVRAFSAGSSIQGPQVWVGFFVALMIRERLRQPSVANAEYDDIAALDSY